MKSTRSTQNRQTFFLRKYWRLPPRRGPPGPPPPECPSERCPPPLGAPSARGALGAGVAAGVSGDAFIGSSGIVFPFSQILANSTPRSDRDVQRKSRARTIF